MHPKSLIKSVAICMGSPSKENKLSAGVLIVWTQFFRETKAITRRASTKAGTLSVFFICLSLLGQILAVIFFM